MSVADLHDPALRSACEQAVLEVLETMFFEFPTGDPVEAQTPAPATATATARFDGSLTGTLCLSISDSCPQRLAAGFLGIEDDQAGPFEQRSVVIELANVLCGATMSRLDPGGRLRIEQPVFGQPASPLPGPWLSFPLECGQLDVHVHFGARS